jgi:hypothetical protein
LRSGGALRQPVALSGEGRLAGELEARFGKMLRGRHLSASARSLVNSNWVRRL